MDLYSDMIEISFILISDRIKRCKPLLLNLKSFEINKSIKKLFEMPDKSFIDITFFIKEYLNTNEENNKINIDEGLVLRKYQSNKINSNINNIEGEINTKKYYTPMLITKKPNLLPEKLDLNSNYEFKQDDINLAQKIFSKILEKNHEDNLNNSIEIINSTGKNNKNTYINKYKTFCLGIFISGLKSPIENSSFIESSRNFISSCGHKNCSNLLSLKPDILSLYLNQESEIKNEINYLVANFCFPLGIKICFENLEDKINKKCINKIYYNIIKNEKDDVYYITTLQYFVKMNYQLFKEKYKYDLISYYTNQNKKDNFWKKIKDDSVIYVPESISLIGRYPFFIPMNICLNIIMSLKTTYEKNCLINHIINEIPIPNKLKKVLFHIPLIKLPITLNHEYNIYKGILSLINNNNNSNYIENVSISQFNTKIFLENIPIENIIFLLELLLLEQQILIVDNNYQILSKIILLLINIIYPLKWINIFLPILSINTVKFLQSPVPFIMGADEYLLKYALNSKNIYISKEVIIYNISSRTFSLGKIKKKMNKKEIINELKLNTLPDNVNKFLENKLKKKKIFMDKNKNKLNGIELDMNIRLIFLKAMLLLLSDYNNYTFFTNDDNNPLFNKEAFIEYHKDKKMKLFLGQMIKTQNFKQFLLNEKELYLLDKKGNNKNNNNDIGNLVDTSYFKKIGEKLKDFINNNIDKTKRRSSFDLNSIIVESDLELKKFNNKKNNSKLKIKYISKKEVDKNINIYNPFTPRENSQIMIDFEDLANAPLKLNNLEKLKNNSIQSYSSKYNNIIVKKKNKIKKILLYPYFIKQTEENKDIKYNIIKEKIYDYNKGFLDINILTNKKFIIPANNLFFDFSQINTLKKNYYIIDNQSNNDINKFTEENNNEINEIKLSTKLFNPDNGQNKINNINNIKENCDLITECFTHCLTSKSRLTKAQFISLEKIFSENYFLNYYSNLLFPDINPKQKDQKKQLTIFSFNDLVSMIKICFSKLKEDEYIIGIRLTLACFSFYKIEKDKKTFVYQNLVKNNYVHKIWMIDTFWLEFFKMEMTEEKRNEEININNLDNDKSVIEFKSKFAIIMEIALFISKIMMNLNLKKEFIINVFEKIILPVYESDYDNINKIIIKIKEMFESLSL